jgi:hypothetical protein
MKNSKEYLNKVSKIIEKPYFREMENYGIISFEDQMYILNKIYGFDIRMFEDWGSTKRIRNMNNNLLYMEHDNGNWGLQLWDNGIRIYYEDCGGKIIDNR